MTPMKTKKYIPPHSRDVEMTVLGAMITSFNCLNVGCDELHLDDFYFVEHKKVFKVLNEIHGSEKSADVLVVSDYLKKNDEFEAVGGRQFLETLSNYVGRISQIDEYVEILKEKSTLRKIAIESANVSTLVSKVGVKADSVLEAAQKAFFDISNTTRKDNYASAFEVLEGKPDASEIGFMIELEKKQERFKKLGPEAAQATGLPTGFSDMDKILHGLSPSNLIIVAARPAMGKTAFALNIARHLSVTKNIPGVIFSLEMDSMQLLKRIICAESGVEGDKLSIGDIDGNDYQKIYSAKKRLDNAPLYLDDTAGVKITDIRSRARRYKKINNLQYIIIDYLQLISGSGSMRSHENRQIEVSEISRMLKLLARELHIPIICLSQLSRKVEDRTSKRPMLSDLRESGAIEQDADQIVFLLREEYYDSMKKPGLLDVIVAKNRHGHTGHFDLFFDKKIGALSNFLGFEEEPSLHDRFTV